jgi:hypothetical protein
MFARDKVVHMFARDGSHRYNFGENLLGICWLADFFFVISISGSGSQSGKSLDPDLRKLKQTKNTTTKSLVAIFYYCRHG